VSVRRQGKGDLGAKDVTEFVNEMLAEIKEKRAE